MDDDVVVVGGGLAGCLAALAAARAGRSVGLVSRAETTLDRASGLVDVLGYTPDGEGPLADPFAAIPDLPSAHPYRTVGVEAVREGLALFDEVTDDRYCGADTDENALVPTYGGRVKPTARYPETVAAGLASQRRPTSLVGFRELTAFDAPLTAERLSRTLPYRVDGLTRTFPADLEVTADRPDPTPLQCARALECDESVDGTSTREELVASLEHFLQMKDRVGFPAVLGVTDTRAIHSTLEDQLGIRVFEVPMGPPSIPGMRLQSVLGDALAGAGVRVETATSVVDVDAAGDHVERLRLEGEVSGTWEASQYVVATGGLTGGGIHADRDGVREAVFGCHVDAPADRSEWAERDPFGDHAFARFGLSVDDEMRPRGADGDPEFRNLRAAGSVLGGYDFAAEKSGSGVSIATGYVAGATAADGC
jgi:glycerol-3-phosphate dehydrogenase subunit B